MKKTTGLKPIQNRVKSKMTAGYTPTEKYLFNLTPEERESLVDVLSNETPEDQSKMLAELVRDWETKVHEK